MQYDIRVQSVATRHLAIVRRRLKWSELGKNLIPLLDRVYTQVRAGRIVQSGHNVFVYSDKSKDGVTVEVGVEVAGQFDNIDEVIYASTPSGEAVTTLHVGPYSDMGQAYDALIRWSKIYNHTLGNKYWEVYGDWNEDPAKLQTEIFYLVGSN